MREDGAAVRIRTPDQRVRVFISSTLGELAVERQSARTSVEQLRLTPILFELGARPHPPRALYRSYLAQSDIFVGIYWQRYGWVVPDMDTERVAAVGGMLLASAVLVAISRGLVLAAGARRADSAFGRFQDGTNSPTLQASLPLGPHLLAGDGVLGLARRPSVSGRIVARGMSERSG